MEDFEKLIAAITALRDSSVSAGECRFFDDSPLVEEVRAWADVCLITNQGTPNFDVHRELHKRLPDVAVTKGESDSFGWLTGIINIKDRGRVVYG